MFHLRLTKKEMISIIFSLQFFKNFYLMDSHSESNQEKLKEIDEMIEVFSKVLKDSLD